MTVSTTGPSGVVGYDPNENLGFEDMDQSDIVIPRLTIDHKAGVFIDSLSGAEYPTLKVIILGQVKQRIMWAKDTDEGDKPLCKSPDHQNGFPSVSDDLPKDKRFPWKTSGLRMADFPPAQGINGLTTLPCGSCAHNQWESPLSGQKKPLCDEQFTYPIMYSPDEGDSWMTALFSVQRTGIKPAKAYTSTFASRKTPMFKNFTNLSLSMMGKGTVVYCVPVFKMGEETDRAKWGEYADQFRSARELVRMPPQNFDEEPEDGDNENGPAPVVVNVTPVPSPVRPKVSAPITQRPQDRTPAPAAEDDPWEAPAPVATAPVVQEDDDEELPF